MGKETSWVAKSLHGAVTIALMTAWTGVAAASPEIALTPTILDYFEVRVGGLALAPYTVTNIGDAPLTVSDMQVAGSDADQFRFDDTFDPVCGTGRDCATIFTLAPGTSSTFWTACATTRVGFFSSTLTVTSDATNAVGNSAIALACAADAPASMSTLTVSPSSISFGVVYAESSIGEASRTLTVTNTATPPSEPVQFRATVPRSGGNGHFSINGAGDETSLSMFPGESVDLVITFHWFGAAESNQPVVLTSIDPSEPPISVPMFAEAAYGHLQFDNPPDPFFGFSLPPVPVGHAATYTIRAHNRGYLALHISDIGVSIFSIDPRDTAFLQARFPTFPSNPRSTSRGRWSARRAVPISGLARSPSTTPTRRATTTRSRSVAPSSGRASSAIRSR
jgi:hypothetical protein